jgi:hypothetical protein
VVGKDLNRGRGTRGGGAGTRCEPRWRAHGWRGPRWWRRRDIEARAKEEQSARCQRGGDRRDLEADVEEERALADE